jgi:hypothetical protein
MEVVSYLSQKRYLYTTRGNPASLLVVRWGDALKMLVEGAGRAAKLGEPHVRSALASFFRISDRLNRAMPLTADWRDANRIGTVAR